MVFALDQLFRFLIFSDVLTNKRYHSLKKNEIQTTVWIFQSYFIWYNSSWWDQRLFQRAQKGALRLTCRRDILDFYPSSQFFKKKTYPLLEDKGGTMVSFRASREPESPPNCNSAHYEQFFAVLSFVFFFAIVIFVE